MGGRGASFGGASLAAISRAMQRSEIIRDAITYGGTSPFESGFWVQNLRNEVSGKMFDAGLEGMTKDIDKVVSQLKSYVDAKRAERKKESEEDRKTREAKEYFRSHYDSNREQREITSSTYKRAQNKLTRDVENFLGIKRK